MRGGQRQVLLLMEMLREAGHESVLLAHEGSPLRQAAIACGFQVFPAEMRVLRRHSIDAKLVHAHDARAHTMAAIASTLEFVVSRRVAFPVRRSLASRWKYRRPARFLAVSQFVAGQLQAAGIDENRIDVVYDAVGSVTPAEPWSAGYPAVALASQDPQKGRGLVEEAAQAAGIPVVFSNDLSSDLRRASMFVYLTKSEGLGSAALLAMSMGVPVIASRAGGLAEVFVDGVSGLFVRNDAQDVAQAMRRILDERGLAPTLIDLGKVRIAQCFTKEHLLAGTLASYGRALA